MDTVNVYDTNDTIIVVTRDAILRRWWDTNNNMVQNQNTDTIIVNWPPTEFLPNRPPTKEAIHNV
jgi:hypothetical protein